MERELSCVREGGREKIEKQNQPEREREKLKERISE
jgi:hypothetical protein